MDFLIITGICLLFIILIAWVVRFSIKEIKKIANRPELDEIANKYPENIEMCKDYLKKLNKEDVVVEENKEASATMYIAISNKILIANLKQNFTRIQTIAHECIHSKQDKRIVMFHFIISNFYLIFFTIITILAVLKKLPFEMMFLVILTVLGFVYTWVRCYLENDAMIKAFYLAKDYMKEKGVSSEEETTQILHTYEEMNRIGIPCINAQILFSVLIKVIVFALACWIF